MIVLGFLAVHVLQISAIVLYFVFRKKARRQNMEEFLNEVESKYSSVNPTSYAVKQER